MKSLIDPVAYSNANPAAGRFLSSALAGCTSTYSNDGLGRRVRKTTAATSPRAA